MSKKALWGVIFTLVVLNCLTIAFFLSPHETSKKAIAVFKENSDETIANIGNAKITRQQWLEKLENKYGKETLREMVNQSVILQLAKKYDIHVSEEELNREIDMIKSSYGNIDKEEFNNEKVWRDQIKSNILLEELLTKDVEIPEQELKNFYEDNKDLYTIEPTFHLFHIVVSTKKDAEQVLNELNKGSSFITLAMEKSTDEFTANQGGDLGYLNEKSEYVPKEYITIAKKLQDKEWSHPIKIKDGYAILYLKDKLAGKTYTFEDVKSQIRRQIALSQMDGPVSAQPFWKEAKVTWFYGNEK